MARAVKLPWLHSSK